MQLELKALQREVGITFVYVTHDQEEALTMSDVIVVMLDGRIQQQGQPTDLYERPINRFVANFIGVSNTLPGRVVAFDGTTRVARVETERGVELAGAVTDPPPPAGQLGLVAASGARTAGHEESYALLVEAIYEGYLQHYGSGRVVESDDPDLALLAGDRLFALGLARLADLGDLAAVTELADVISLAAQAQAEGDAERAAAVWAAGVFAVGHGSGPELEAAKAAARAGSEGAAQALHAAAAPR